MSRCLGPGITVAKPTLCIPTSNYASYQRSSACSCQRLGCTHSCVLPMQHRRVRAIGINSSPHECHSCQALPSMDSCRPPQTHPATITSKQCWKDDLGTLECCHGNAWPFFLADILAKNSTQNSSILSIGHVGQWTSGQKRAGRLSTGKALVSFTSMAAQ